MSHIFTDLPANMRMVSSQGAYSLKEETYPYLVTKHVFCLKNCKKLKIHKVGFLENRFIILDLWDTCDETIFHAYGNSRYDAVDALTPFFGDCDFDIPNKYIWDYSKKEQQPPKDIDPFFDQLITG